ncbi:MAG: MerR family transcriptional regulator [Clostridiales bacterium]
MKKEGLYSIGEISKICNISASALRYYGEMGIINPVCIDNETGYRYYDSQTLMIVPVLRYYQMLGFKLKEIVKLLEREDLSYLKALFEDKISIQKKDIAFRIAEMESVDSWLQLINETEEIMAMENCPITCQYFSTIKVFSQKPHIFPDMKFENLLINNEFCNSATSRSGITLGALYISFPSVSNRFSGDFKEINLYIRNHSICDDLSLVTEIGGFSAVVSYHKGSYKTLDETYKKMKSWAQEHGFQLRGDSLERYVIDYWSIKNSDWFLTQIFLPII